MIPWFTSSIASFHFLNPFMLLALAGLPLLVLAYMRREQSRRHLVSSILVLKQLSKKATPRKRFFPPLRFFLELLALLALVFGASGPLHTDSGEKIAVLFDTSLSMQAQSTEARGRTRFDAAVEKFSQWLTKQKSGNTYFLFTAAPRLLQVGDTGKLRAVNSEQETQGMSSSAILALVKAIEPTLAADSLEGAANELLGSGRYEKLVIVSDKQVDVQGGIQLVETLIVGAPVPNVALQSLRIERRDLAKDSQKIVASVATTGGAAGRCEVDLSFIDLGGTASRMQTQPIQLPTNGLLDVSFQIAESQAQGFYQVLLRPKDGDALAEDNIGTVSVQEAQTASILMVEPNPNLGDLGLSSLPGFSVRQLTPEAFAALSDDELMKSQVVVFHGTAPRRLFSRPALIVVPPNDNPLFPGKAEVSSPRISSWLIDHPLLSYLKVPLLNPAASVVFRENAYGKAIIRAESGPIALAGEANGARFVVLGFEIFPFEGLKTPIPTVLTLNILSWLRGGAQLGEERRTGGSLDLRQSKQTLTKIVGTGKAIQRDIDPRGVIELAYSGGYVLQDEQSSHLELLAVNAFHTEESDTGDIQSIVLSSAGKEREGNQNLGFPLWRYAALVALVCILLETVLALRGREQEAA